LEGRTSRSCWCPSRISGDCDAVVVGAGLAGLSAGAFLAQAGADVLVVERANAPGGYARPVRHGSVTADLAVSELPTGVEDELLDGILAFLGVRDRCIFEPVEGFYRALLPGFELDVPLGLESFAEAHAEIFPGEAAAISRFVDLCAQILEDTHRLPLQLTFDQLDDVAARFPVFFGHVATTVADVLDEFFTDERLKATLAATWPQAGLPPARLSFATYAQGLALYAGGIVVPRGGLGAVVEALADVLGDRLMLGREAVGIGVADGRVVGAELAGGERLGARAVVAAGDARHALTALLEPGVLSPRLIKRVERMRPSVSAYVLVAAAPAGAEVPPLTFLHDGSSARWISAHNGTLVVRALASSTLTEDEGKLLFAALARDAETIAPGARVLSTIAPADLERLTANTAGAAFGWENTPQQTGGRRLSIVTPVDGLFLAGHWAQPGHGAYRAILSGMHAARAVLDRHGRGDAIPEFRSAGN
jgi:phytoene dehydrogenase-like protein